MHAKIHFHPLNLFLRNDHYGFHYKYNFKKIVIILPITFGIEILFFQTQFKIFLWYEKKLFLVGFQIGSNENFPNPLLQHLFSIIFFRFF
jgi:hypothetical protein